MLISLNNNNSIALTAYQILTGYDFQICKQIRAQNPDQRMLNLKSWHLPYHSQYKIALLQSH